MPEITLNDGRRVSYRIRESRRSRRVRLTLNPRDGLVLVTPPRQDAQWLAQLVNDWREWIADRLDDMAIELNANGDTIKAIPQCVDLPALQERWQVLQRFQPGTRVSVRVSAPGSLILVRGQNNTVEACKALQRWLARRARDTLPDWLQRVSTEIKLPCGAVSVRSQRSRWGSCSAHGDISLNQQLLFLPPEWVRHILIHELCHTLELNHSDRFWAHVERFDPDYRTTRVLVRSAWPRVPVWAQI